MNLGQLLTKNGRARHTKKNIDNRMNNNRNRNSNNSNNNETVPIRTVYIAPIQPNVSVCTDNFLCITIFVIEQTL